MQDVMVDLETLGRRAGCVVLSIGAVQFDPATKELGEELYEVVRLETCIAAGLQVDPETEAWWRKQSPEARQVLTQAEKKRGNKPLPKALQVLSQFLLTSGGDVRVWGNGSDFDNSILVSCYAAIGQDPPWKFWNNRCYRTLKSLLPTVKLTRTGTYHNALDDAKSQATHAIHLLNKLPKRRK